MCVRVAASALRLVRSLRETSRLCSPTAFDLCRNVLGRVTLECGIVISSVRYVSVLFEQTRINDERNKQTTNKTKHATREMGIKQTKNVKRAIRMFQSQRVTTLVVERVKTRSGAVMSLTSARKPKN